MLSHASSIYISCLRCWLNLRTESLAWKKPAVVLALTSREEWEEEIILDFSYE